MSNDLMTGMTLEFCKAAVMQPNDYAGVMDGKDVFVRERMAVGIKAALDWLAANTTQEMLDAADYELSSDDSFVTKEVIAAALRKAAGK